MCGIIGFRKFNNLNIDLNISLDEISHRGPDDVFTYVDGDLSLGIVRLSIIDINNGKQPFFNKNKDIVVIYNGEIYNHKQIRAELESEGVSFSSQNSDGEIIPFLYEKYGVNFVRKIRGMFAISIYDKRTSKLYLFRDRIGERPIYYSFSEEGFIFSSEYNVISKCLSYIDLDLQSLSWFFSFKAPLVDSTIDNRIKRLNPGHYIVINEDNSFNINSYYSLNLTRQLDLKNPVEELDLLLNSAVKEQVDVDVPLGAFLSGGIDSSLIVQLANNHSNQCINTFSLVYYEDINNKSLDRKYSRMMAEKLKTNHIEKLLTPEEFLNDLPLIVSQYGQPTSSTFSNWFMTKEMKGKIKVALSGDGPDELFGSYFLHRTSSLFDIIGSKKYIYNETAEDLFVKNNMGKEFYEILDSFSVFSSDEKFELLKIKNIREKSLKLLKEKTELISLGTQLDRNLRFEFKHTFVEQVLHYSDVLSMANSIEVRIPFLDYRIVDFSFSLPDMYKCKGNETKIILKDLATRYLPKEVVYRPKEGFIEPNLYWLHKYFIDFAIQTFNISKSNDLGIVNWKYVDKILNKFILDNDYYLGKKIWTLLLYSIWENLNSNKLYKNILWNH